LALTDELRGLDFFGKEPAAQANNQKSQQNRIAIAEKQLMAFQIKRKTLESALRSEKIRAFKQDIEARVRLLEQDVRTGMVDVKNLNKKRSLLKQTLFNIERVVRHRQIKPTMPDTTLTYRGSQHVLTPTACKLAVYVISSLAASYLLGELLSRNWGFSYFGSCPSTVSTFSSWFQRALPKGPRERASCRNGDMERNLFTHLPQRRLVKRNLFCWGRGEGGVGPALLRAPPFSKNHEYLDI
jgi:hypothetical protein